VGYDLRKVADRGQAEVLDASGTEIGAVLSCATDMAIGWHEGRLCSIASPNRPEGFTPTGLCCGFLRVRSRIEPGRVVELRDNRRKIRVMVVKDIRPDRTARRPMKEML
jgi:aminomethyltransferase